MVELVTMTGCDSSFLVSLIGNTTSFEIVLDNAKSHAVILETVEATAKARTVPRQRKRYDCPTLQETKDEQEELKLDLDDLRDSAPSDDRLNNSYPCRKHGPGTRHKAATCRWEESSLLDSDFAYKSCHVSFDGMLKEASSTTKSARMNVSRPTRRDSIKTCQ